MNKSPKTVFSLLIPAVIFVAAGAAIFAFQNFSNKRVLSGFAGYVYSKPIFGQNRFEGILIGPSSTGWAWRKEVSKVSITPDTTVEEFDARNGGAILGKDKLPISCKASLVYRLDPSRVKEFMEDYGGIAQSSGRNDPTVEIGKPQPFHRTDMKMIFQRLGTDSIVKIPGIQRINTNSKLFF